MLDTSISRLAKMHGDRTKTLAKDSPDIAALNAEQEKVENRLNTAIATRDDNRQVVDDKSKERDRLDGILRSHEPVKKLQNERQELESKFSEIEAEETTHHAERTAFIRKYTILLNLYPRIRRTLDIIKEKESNGDLPPAIDKDLIKKLLEDPSGKCPICDGEIGDSAIEHLNNLLQQFKVSSQTSNYLKEIKAPLKRILMMCFASVLFLIICVNTKRTSPLGKKL